MSYAQRFRLLVAAGLAALLLWAAGCGGGGGGGSSFTPPNQPPSPPLPPPSPLQQNESNLPSGVVGKPYTASVPVSGGKAPLQYSALQDVPAWLAVGATTGQLTGTPTETRGGYIKVRVTDSSTPPQTLDAMLSLSVAAVLTISDVPGGTRGLAYTAFLSTLGGSPPVQWQITGGALPPGLNLSAQNGQIYGTPAEAGTFSATVQATDSALPPQVVQKEMPIVIDTKLAITSQELPYAVESRSFSATASITNGVAPFTWQVAWLPAGLALDPVTGVISGTPGASGNFLLSLTVSDSSTPVQTATGGVYLNIFGKLSIPVSNGNVIARQGWFFPLSLRAAARGGVEPMAWRQLDGMLPPGMTLAPNGSLDGSPTELGTFDFSVEVQDSADPPQTARKRFSVMVRPSFLNMPFLQLPRGRAGTPYSFTFPAATGGTSPRVWAVRDGYIPLGLSLSPDGVLSGTPQEDGTQYLIAEVTDSSVPSQTDFSSFEFYAAPAINGPNNTPASAARVENGATDVSISPYADPPDVAAPDADYFKFDALAGSIVNVWVTLPFDSVMDSVLELVDSNGNTLTTCRNPGDDNVPPPLVADATPTLFDDPCVNDDISVGVTLESSLSLQVPGAPGTVTQVVPHVLDFRGDARPDMGYRLNVGGALEPFRFLNLPPPIGSVQSSYQHFLRTSGAYLPVNFTLEPGSDPLPSGLTMQGDGTIRGFPTAAGETTHHFRATDALDRSAVRTLTIRIIDRIQVLTDALPDAVTGVPYSATVEISGGLRPRMELSTFAWPCCIHFLGSTFTGIPQEPGTYSASIGIIDDSGQGLSRDYTLRVLPGTLQIVTTSLPSGSVGAAYRALLDAKGGTPDFAWTIETGTLPPGLALSASFIHGTPTTAGTYPLRLRVTDTGTPAQSQVVDLQIVIQ